MELNYYSAFPCTNGPVFNRGGGYNDTTNAGLFYFGNPNGNANSNHTFRPVLATLWYYKFFLPIKTFLYGDCIG